LEKSRTFPLLHRLGVAIHGVWAVDFTLEPNNAVDWRRISFPTKRSLERWETERKKGALRFILLKGLLGFGMVMYMGTSAAFYFAHWGTLPLTLRGGGNPLFALVCFLIAGVIWAVVTWALIEIPYASHRRKPIRF